MLVTGGAAERRHERAAAQRLAWEGAVVHVTDRDADGAEAVAAGIRSSGGLAVTTLHDVTNETDWDRVIVAIVGAHRRLDVLVNNAGVAVLKMLDALSTADLLRQIDVNLTSVYYGARCAVKEMRRIGEGFSIINLSSVAGLVGVPTCSAYAASKGGIRLFTKAVALETALEGIRVNSVRPGMIMTNIQKVAQAATGATYDLLDASIPMGRSGEPLDVANSILFLTSDKSRYITGTELTVDGGMTAQ